MLINRRIKRLVSLLLIITIFTTTLSSCYEGKENKRKIKTDKSNIELLPDNFIEDTLIETESNELISAYENLSEVLKSTKDNAQDEIKDSAKELKNSISEYVENINSNNTETYEKIKNISPEIESRQKHYEEKIKENSQKVINALDIIINTQKGCESEEYLNAVDTVENYFITDTYLTTSTDIVPNAAEPNMPVVENVEDMDEYFQQLATSSENNYEENDYSGNTETSENKDSLIITDETVMTEEMKALVDELKTPLNIYLYIKNNINTEYYYGFRKGATATFESRGGNDSDQASLLIAMLRYLKYPARYVTGTVLLSNEDAMELTCTDTPANAANILAAGGKPVTTIISGGKIVGIKTEQTWVQAYIPYTDYRGAGNAKGESLWIELDTSIKAYEKVEGIYDKMNELGITQEAYDEAVKNGTVNEFIQKIENIDENDINPEKAVINTRCIIKEELGYLPLSLQYQIVKRDKTYNEVQDSETDRIIVSIDNEKLTELKSLELYKKRLTIEYAPETAYDKEVIEKYNGIFNVPSYLVKMVPQLKLDGEVIGKGQPVTLGENQTLTITVHSGKDTDVITNKITSGSIYQITEDMQFITDKELEKAEENAKDMAATINVDNVYSDEYLGKILDLAGKMYFVQVDIANMAMAEKMNISYSRSLSIGMTGYSVKTSRMMGIPVGISEGSLYIDVDLNKMSVVSRDGDRQSAIRYAMTTGVAASYYESLIWEEITGEKAVSSISIIEAAKEENQKIKLLSKANYNEEKQNLNLPSDIRTSIEEAINDGKIVTIHTDEIIIDEWKGFGYIITDPYTGAGAYMISGGLSGGSTGSDVSLAFLVNTGLDIADIIQSAMLLINISKAFSIGGPVGMAIGAVIAVMAVTTIIYAVMDYITNRELMIEYMEGNEAAGDELKQNANLNVGITLGVGVFSASAKGVVKTAAKNKVVKELGEEIAERLLKNTDDATNITKYLKNIKKAGVSQDAIKRVADTSGEAGLKWLEKQTKEGISKEVVEKIAKNANDCTKYTDELMEIIGLYEGRTDDIIEYVNKNGDDGVEEIFKLYESGLKTRVFREATKQDVDLISEIKTKYNAGKTRNAASAKGIINGESIDLECISGKFSHENYYNKGNFEPPQPENYHYKGPIPEYTNHTEQKIVEYLRERFKDNLNTSGEIEIISERVYCDNCKVVVDMFENEFPNIKVIRVEVFK